MAVVVKSRSSTVPDNADDLRVQINRLEQRMSRPMPGGQVECDQLALKARVLRDRMAALNCTAKRKPIAPR